MRYNPLKPNKTARPARPKPLAKGVVPSPDPVSHVPTLSENEVKDGLELRFPTRPDAATLAAFHSTRDLPRDEQWHWHRRGGFWYARRNDRSRLFATTLIARITAGIVPTAPTAAVGVTTMVVLPDPPPPATKPAAPIVAEPAPSPREMPSAAISVGPPANILPVRFVPVADELAKWRAAMLAPRE